MLSCCVYSSHHISLHVTHSGGEHRVSISHFTSRGSAQQISTKGPLRPAVPHPWMALAIRMLGGNHGTFLPYAKVKKYPVSSEISCSLSNNFSISVCDANILIYGLIKICIYERLRVTRLVSFFPIFLAGLRWAIALHHADPETGTF